MIDVSCRTEARLLEYAGAVYSIQRGLAGHDEVKIYLLAHGLELVYDGSPIRGRDTFNRRIGPSLTHISAELAKPGTLINGAFEQLARDVTDNRAQVIAVITTDGGVEDSSAKNEARLRASIQSIAEHPNAKLLLLGVSSHLRMTWSTRLAPLGHRGLVRGDNDFGDAIHQMEPQP